MCVFLTSALVGDQLHAPAALPLRKESRYLLCRSEHSWPYRESNSGPSVVQSIASNYTDRAILSWANLRRNLEIWWRGWCPPINSLSHMRVWTEFSLLPEKGTPQHTLCWVNIWRGEDGRGRGVMWDISALTGETETIRKTPLGLSCLQTEIWTQ
jgi:hypothetical protein